MRFLLDARYLTRSFGGIRTYSECLIEALAQLDHSNEYIVVTQPDYAERLNVGPNFRFVTYPARAVSLKTVLRFHTLIGQFAPDAVHAHYPIVPAFYKAPLVVTVHDLQPLQMGEWTGGRPLPMKWAYDAFYHWAYPFAFRRATRLICDSESTRESLGRLDPAFLKKTRVAHLALPSGAGERPNPQIIDELRTRHNLPQRYAIFIGSTRPNKNIPNMLRAFASMRRTTQSNRDVAFALVLGIDRFFAEIQRLIDELRLREQVIVLPEMGLEPKRALYRNAEALFFITKFEGFGLPILEAQAQSLPVLTSTADCLPEVAGDSALLCDPDNVEEMAAKMDQILSDPPLRSRLIERGALNLKRFDWRHTANETLKALQESVQ